MTNEIKLLIIGTVFIISGIFKWNPVLAIFLWRDRPITDKGIKRARILSIIVGILAIACAITV